MESPMYPQSKDAHKAKFVLIELVYVLRPLQL